MTNKEFLMNNIASVFEDKMYSYIDNIATPLEVSDKEWLGLVLRMLSESVNEFEETDEISFEDDIIGLVKHTLPSIKSKLFLKNIELCQ